MTVEEFISRSRVVEETRELRPHEFGDLRILRRSVQKHGNVAPIEEYLLSIIGVPQHGYLVKLRPKPVVKRAQQQTLF